MYTHKHISPLNFLSSILQNLKGGTRCTYSLHLFGNIMTIRLKLQREINCCVLEVMTLHKLIREYRETPPEDVHIEEFAFGMQIHMSGCNCGELPLYPGTSNYAMK